MSSINPHPTFRYSQPEAYRFSHDSVFLARRVFELTAPCVRPEMRVLDLCAGCGIVGMDFLYHCGAELGIIPESCDFVEVQSEYEEHFALNAKGLDLANCRLNFHRLNYSALTAPSHSKTYDLILCNPPFFQASQGKLPPNPFKRRCRFFVDCDLATLMDALVNVLKPKAEAYVLLRAFENGARDRLKGRAHAEPVGDIRGTPLWRITRDR